MSRELNIGNLTKLSSIEKTKADKYYMETFERMVDGRRFIWNWNAALFGPMWLVYRKAYGGAFVMTAMGSILAGSITFLILYLAFLFANDNKKAFFLFTIAASVITGLSIIVVQGYIGNFLYFRSLKRRISHQYHRANLKNIDRLSIFLFVVMYVFSLAFVVVGQLMATLVFYVFVVLNIVIRYLVDRRKVRKTLQKPIFENV